MIAQNHNVKRQNHNQEHARTLNYKLKTKSTGSKEIEMSKIVLCGVLRIFIFSLALAIFSFKIEFTV